LWAMLKSFTDTRAARHGLPGRGRLQPITPALGLRWVSGDACAGAALPLHPKGHRAARSAIVHVAAGT